jgi:hypothetical protein
LLIIGLVFKKWLNSGIFYCMFIEPPSSVPGFAVVA